MPSLPILDDIPITVMAIADLRALVNHRNNEIVRVRSTENDFRFDSSSPALEDGISVVKPINVNMLAPGRWLVIVYPFDLAVSGWTLLFTRKVVTGTASDSDYVETGIIYDPLYEYLLMSVEVSTPSPALTTPTISAVVSVVGIGQTMYYKPDGVTSLGNQANYSLPSNQVLAGLEAAILLTVGQARMSIPASGAFKTKWTYDNRVTKDGHWMIARRRRYG